MVDDVQESGLQEYSLPDDMHIREDYRIFPRELEDDPNVVFHGTAQANFDSIVNGA
jgi:hypothetical protein